MLNKKIILCGHYGSGKSEIASNIILNSNFKKKKFYDLDIVNPYFRNNLLINEFKKQNITYISGTVAGLNADLPSIPNVTMDEDEAVVIDLGGNSVGAKILNLFSSQTFKDAKLYIVINCNRPETKNIDGIMLHLRGIENILDKKIDGIISNTHLLKETTISDIIKGYLLTKEIEKNLGLPVVAITYPKDYINRIDLIDALNKINADKHLLFPLVLNLRENWMC